MWLFRKKVSLALGIDISSYSIEAMALTSERDVVAYERALLEEGIIQNGSIQKKDLLQAKLDQVLAKLYARAKNVRGARTVVNIPDQQTYTRYFDVPVNLSGADLTAYLRKEAGIVIPLEAGDMTASYIVVGGAKQSQTTKLVLFVGAKKEVTQSILEVLHAVEVDSPVLDLESLALMRSLLPAHSTDAVLILDGGSEASTMHIFEGYSLPIISVACPAGGVRATQRVAERTGLSFDEAEKVKCAFGLLKAPHSAEEPSPSLPDSSRAKNTKDDVAREVSLVLHDWYQLVISDAQKAVAFYETNFGKRISGIILAGGAALLPGAASYLTAWMGRPVRVGNPLINLRNVEILGKEKPSLMYTTVVGLALRGIDPSATNIDFVHGTITETKNGFLRERRSLFSIGALVLMVVLLVAALYGAFLFFGRDAEIFYERMP